MTITRLAQAKRLVIKVGSALVTNNGEGLDLNAITEWARPFLTGDISAETLRLLSAEDCLHMPKPVSLGDLLKAAQENN